MGGKGSEEMDKVSIRRLLLKYLIHRGSKYGSELAFFFRFLISYLWKMDTCVGDGWKEM